MTTNTADPYGAQAHARAMAGTKVESMPTLPPWAAESLPAGVAAKDMVWAETIAAGGYAAKRLDRGARVRLTDLQGDACASVLVFNAESPIERLTDMGRVLMSLIEDGAGTHDAFCGASNRASNARKYGEGDNWGPHPNARDRFALAVAKFGLGRKDIHPCLNLFKGVRIAPDGAVEPEVGPFPPGRAVTLRAEMAVILVLANCPHVADPRPDYRVTPLRVDAWRGPVTPEDDPVRNATPEGQRAFLNVEDYYRR